MILQEDRDAMAAHELFGKSAGALGQEMAVLQTDGLLVQAGISDDGRRDLGVVGFHNTDPILGQILLSNLKGRSVRDGLDHLGIQQAKSFSAARNLVSHRRRPRSS